MALHQVTWGGVLHARSVAEQMVDWQGQLVVLVWSWGWLQQTGQTDFFITVPATDSHVKLVVWSWGIHDRLGVCVCVCVCVCVSQ